MSVDLSRRLAVARGDEPADLAIKGGQVLSVFTREWLKTDVAIVDGVIAGLGDYEGKRTLDATGRYLVPGFVDMHVHGAGKDKAPDLSYSYKLWLAHGVDRKSTRLNSSHT